VVKHTLISSYKRVSVKENVEKRNKEFVRISC